jgi:hypothetical protein
LLPTVNPLFFLVADPFFPKVFNGIHFFALWTNNAFPVRPMVKHFPA